MTDIHSLQIAEGMVEEAIDYLIEGDDENTVSLICQLEAHINEYFHEWTDRDTTGLRNELANLRSNLGHCA